MDFVRAKREVRGKACVLMGERELKPIRLFSEKVSEKRKAEKTKPSRS